MCEKIVFQLYFDHKVCESKIYFASYDFFLFFFILFYLFIYLFFFFFWISQFFGVK